MFIIDLDLFGNHFTRLELIEMEVFEDLRVKILSDPDIRFI